MIIKSIFTFRCDVGIKELVREVRDCSRNLGKIKHTSETHSADHDEKNKLWEGKLGEVERVIKKIQADQNRQISTLKGNY